MLRIVLEMIELRELDTARAILMQTQAMGVMKQEQPERYLRLPMVAIYRHFHCKNKVEYEILKL